MVGSPDIGGVACPPIDPKIANVEALSEVGLRQVLTWIHQLLEEA